MDYAYAIISAYIPKLRLRKILNCTRYNMVACLLEQRQPGMSRQQETHWCISSKPMLLIKLISALWQWGCLMLSSEIAHYIQ